MTELLIILWIIGVPLFGTLAWVMWDEEPGWSIGILIWGFVLAALVVLHETKAVS